MVKYITGIFNLRPQKPKLKNVWDLDILFRCIDRAGDITLLTNMILRQKVIVLLLLFGARRDSTICVFTVDNVALDAMSLNVLPNKVLKGHSIKDSQVRKPEYRAYKDKFLCKRFHKGAVSGLRQFLVTESPLEMIKKSFLFHFKSSFRS